MSMNNPMSNIPPLGQPTAMMPGMGQSKFKPVDPMRVLRTNWLWIAAAALLGAGIGFGAWYGLNKNFAKYTSSSQFEVQASRSNGNFVSNINIKELEPIIMREVQVIRAEPTLRQTLTSPAVQNTQWFSQFNNDLEEAFEDLDENVLSASPVRGAPLFNVRATTAKPADAQIILAALNQEFMRRQSERIEGTFARDLQAAQRRLNSAEERITRIRGEIKRFLNTTPLETLDERSAQATLRVQYLVSKISELTDTYNGLEASYAELMARQKANNFDPTGEERQLIEARPELQNIDRQLLALRIAREPLVERFEPEHRSIKEIDIQILSLERERKSKFDELARTLFDAKVEQTALNRQILSQSLAMSNQELTELKIQRQEFVRLKQEYDTFVRELQQAEGERTDATSAIEDLREQQQAEARVVVREVVPPQLAKLTFPPHPAVMTLGLAVLLGGLVTGLTFLRELMDQRVRSAADIKLVPDAALIGTVPSADEDPGGGRVIERVVEHHPTGLLAEAFRQVRTAVLSKIDRRGYKTLLVVSAKPNAGVTTTAQNLAASCALSGRRVLLIDANLRRPMLASVMGLTSQPGLADILRGDYAPEKFEACLQASETEGLSLLPAGNSTKAAVELFENPRFRELMARLESSYDLLLIDAPPALLTSDAQLLSRHVDAMVLVSRSGVDTRGMLQRLYRELDGQRADILGIVLNGVQAAAGGYLKRNFQEFHDYSGPERRKAPRAKTARSNGSPRAAATQATALQDAAEHDDDNAGFGGLDAASPDEDKA